MDRLDREQVFDKSVEVLFELFDCYIIFFRDILDDFLNGMLAVNATPQGSTGLIEDIEAVDVGQLAFDGNQEEFARDFALNKVRMFDIDFIHECKGQQGSRCSELLPPIIIFGLEEPVPENASPS